MIKANNQSGLTLIELMISMVIAGMLLGIMVLAFTAQSKTYNTQQEVSTLQEDMKAALQVMSRDVRMAGYNPAGISGASVPSVTAATLTTFHATQDLDGSGVLSDFPEEDVLYSFITPAAGSTASLMRTTNGVAAQPVIDNLTHVGFQYLVVTPGGSTTPDTRDWKFAPVAGDLPNIHAVNICIQGRTPRQTSSATDTGTFTAAFKTTVAANTETASDFTAAAAAWTPATPGKYQWRTMCVEVKCRNLQ